MELGYCYSRYISDNLLLSNQLPFELCVAGPQRDYTLTSGENITVRAFLDI